MKDIQLKSEAYQYLTHSFKEWLETVGYSDKTIYDVPKKLVRFLYYLEEQEYDQIDEISSELVIEYFDYLKTRRNLRREGGGLSARTLGKEKQALHLLLEYLRKVGRQLIEKPKLIIEDNYQEEIRTLTLGEIKKLFYETETYNEPPFSEVLNARDRAMLVVFYSAGLRRSEGAQINIGDVYFEQKFIAVEHGKNYTNRKVPLNKTNLKYLEDYIYNHRPKLMKNSGENALFINLRGKRLGSQGLYLRLKKLMGRSGINPENLGLHTLRHSIATHLLENGMSLEMISRFLGHSSLESTQIYTHIDDSGKNSIKQPYKNIPKREITQLNEDEL